jgi:cytochrome c-type biogenesis protein CcmF
MNLILPIINNKIINIKRKHIIRIISIEFILIVIIIIGIIYSYIISDFTILNIKENSHSTLPLLYKITGLWGNHEGSMLLWCFLLICNNYLITITGIKISTNIILKYVNIQSFICFFFLFFIIYTSNPYINLYIYNINGSELNPILQDTVLAIHPPLIYLGYIGSSISYTLLLIILIERELYNTLKIYIYINILISWSFLTIGILLGSWWSYYELGWGGWWFRDPVENAALLPWLLMIIVIHTIKYNSLIYWTVFVGIFIFIFSLLGTFFVRSGILVSVHSFAVDYYRGYFIFGFILMIIVLSIYLFIQNINYIFKYTYYKYNAYNNIILINCILVSVFFFTVLIGTILPTVLNIFMNINISIGISFYNYILTPLIIPLLIIMSFILNISNKLDDYSKYYKFSFGSLLPIIFFMILYKMDNYYLFFIILLLLILLLCSFFIYIYHFNIINAMIISHFGIFIFIMGIIISNIMNLEYIKIMFPGDEILLNNHIFNLRTINYIIASNYYSLYGNIAVINNAYDVNILFPEKRYYFIKGIYITKSNIYSNYFTDIYAIIGDGNYSLGWYTKFYYRPLMSFIWIGPLFFIFGVMFSIFNFISFKYRQLLVWY